jgi:hypothetical protein
MDLFHPTCKQNKVAACGLEAIFATKGHKKHKENILDGSCDGLVIFVILRGNKWPAQGRAVSARSPRNAKHEPFRQTQGPEPARGEPVEPVDGLAKR